MCLNKHSRERDNFVTNQRDGTKDTGNSCQHHKISLMSLIQCNTLTFQFLYVLSWVTQSFNMYLSPLAYVFPGSQMGCDTFHKCQDSVQAAIISLVSTALKQEWAEREVDPDADKTGRSSEELHGR